MEFATSCAHPVRRSFCQWTPELRGSGGVIGQRPARDRARLTQACHMQPRTKHHHAGVWTCSGRVDIMIALRSAKARVT